MPFLKFIDRCEKEDIMASTANGVTVLTELLRCRGWEVEKYQGTVDSNVLEEADVIIVAYPTESFSGDEIEAMLKFVNEGGGIFLVGEWGNVHENADTLNTIAHNFSIAFNGDRICDPTYYIRKGLKGKVFDVPVFNLRPHAITEGVKSFRIVSACSLTAPYDNIIAWGSQESFSDLDFDSELDAFETGQYVPVFAVATYGNGRVAAVGDLSWLSNEYIINMGNAQLALNTLSWLIKRL